MQDEPEDRGQLGRREFVKRSVMAAAAAAAAGPLLGAERLTRIAQAHGGIPPLRAPGRVGGLAARANDLVAVGMDGDVPFVWTFRFGEDTWKPAAGLSAFPAGTGLSSMTALGELLLAAGSITNHVPMGTVHVQEPPRFEDVAPRRPGELSFRPPHHPQGQPYELDAHHVRPAIFASSDGVRWELVLDGVAGIAGGALNAIATVDSSRVLAVGPEMLGLDIEEGDRVLALVSSDGRTWLRAELGGVTHPHHGDVTLLAGIGNQILLGTTAVGAAELYTAPRSAPILPAADLPVGAGIDAGALSGPWRRMASPLVEGPVSFVAAAPAGGGVLLAGIDHLDNPRFWELRGGSWFEVGPPEGVGARGRLYDIETVGGSLFGGGSDGAQTLVAKVRG